jgi:hypothetical protein
MPIDEDGGAGTGAVPGADPGGAPARLSASHRTALDARQVDRDRTLAAVHELEAALDAAAFGRVAPWLVVVLHALDALSEAMVEEDRNASRPDGLLSDIARTQPRLRTRVRGLRVQYRHLREAIDRFRSELRDDASDDVLDAADVRQRLAWLIGALRHQRARESDLIYEAYYEAFARDVEDDAAELS